MALIQLEEEQIRTWTRAQKDEWWFKNVYRGEMPPDIAHPGTGS